MNNANDNSVPVLIAEQTPESTVKMRNQRIGVLAAVIGVLGLICTRGHIKPDEWTMRITIMLVAMAPFILMLIYFAIRYANPKAVLTKCRKELRLDDERLQVLRVGSAGEKTLQTVDVERVKKVKFMFPYLDLKIGVRGNPRIDTSPYDQHQVLAIVEAIKKRIANRG